MVISDRLNSRFHGFKYSPVNIFNPQMDVLETMVIFALENIVIQFFRKAGLPG